MLTLSESPFTYSETIAKSCPIVSTAKEYRKFNPRSISSRTLSSICPQTFLRINLLTLNSSSLYAGIMFSSLVSSSKIVLGLLGNNSIADTPPFRPIILFPAEKGKAHHRGRRSRPRGLFYFRQKGRVTLVICCSNSVEIKSGNLNARPYYNGLFLLCGAE